jgi:hypothetical protein
MIMHYAIMLVLAEMIVFLVCLLGLLASASLSETSGRQVP